MLSRLPPSQPVNLTSLFLAAFSLLALALGYWTFVARAALIARTDNPRALIAFNRIHRGNILDRNGQLLAETTGRPGEYVRRYEPAAALVTGYASFTYGLSGIEAAADGTLTGLEGQDDLTRWWRYDVLNEPLIGGDVQLTLDLDLQQAAFNALAGRAGAIVVVEPATGDILALASSPAFDPATIDADFESLAASPDGPFVNRATDGLYRADALLDLFPGTLDLSTPFSFPIHTQPAEGGRITPLHAALLVAAAANNGVMPAPKLILRPQSLAAENHPLSLLPSPVAGQLNDLLSKAAGLAFTVPSGFGDETLGWFVGLTSDRARAICVVLEDSNAAAASAAALLTLSETQP